MNTIATMIAICYVPPWQYRCCMRGGGKDCPRIMSDCHRWRWSGLFYSASGESFELPSPRPLSQKAEDEVVVVGESIELGYPYVQPDSVPPSPKAKVTDLEEAELNTLIEYLKAKFTTPSESLAMKDLVEVSSSSNLGPMHHFANSLPTCVPLIYCVLIILVLVGIFFLLLIRLRHKTEEKPLVTPLVIKPSEASNELTKVS